MPDRTRLKAAEAWEEERQMNELNASLDRARKRELLAHAIASERFEGDDDVSIEPPDEEIESVDGGYWVQARVFVYADDVEERMN